MDGKNAHDLKMIIYHNKSPIITCKPDYLGFMGIFLKGIHLGFPVGTPVEIEFQSHKKNNKDQRVSMVVNNSEDNGTGLRLKDFEKDITSKWQNILRATLHFAKKKP